MMNRKEFLLSSATAALGAGLRLRRAQAVSPADLSLRIEPCTLEIGSGINIHTVAYNAAFQALSFA
jgi:hypothetical protein